MKRIKSNSFISVFVSILALTGLAFLFQNCSESDLSHLKLPSQDQVSNDSVKKGELKIELSGNPAEEDSEILLGSLNLLSSQDVTLTVSNIGNAPLEIEELLLIPTIGDAQSIRIGTTAVGTLEPGESRQITLTFNPRQVGAQSSNLVASYNNSEESVSQSYVVSGEGVTGDLQLNVTRMTACNSGAYSFSNSLVSLGTLNNRTCDSKITITNTGSGNLTVNSLGLVGNHIQFQGGNQLLDEVNSVTEAFPVTIPPGESRTVQVRVGKTFTNAQLNEGVNIATNVATASLQFVGTNFYQDPGGGR